MGTSLGSRFSSIRMFGLTLSLALGLQISTTLALAGDLQWAFNELKSLPIDYETYGNVCEQITRLDLQKRFPPATHEVLTGIAYVDDQGVAGELDAVVFRRTDGEVLLIAEVKCWKNLRDAFQKATSQRTRFLGALAAGHNVEFYWTHNKTKTFHPSQFDSKPPFIFVSQKGGEEFGFDQSIDFTLPEVDRIRESLLQCVNTKKCVAP